MIRPFGFKGSGLSELWQVACSLESASGISAEASATQSVLFSEPELFAYYGEEKANSMMYALTRKSLDFCEGQSFRDPSELFWWVFPQATDFARKVTGGRDVSKTFVLNSLVAIDNAAWLLYAAEDGIKDFDLMIPAAYKSALPARLDKLAVMYMVSYEATLDEIRRAAEEGYFLFKIKIGQPGSQEEMLQKDKQRLSDIHSLLQTFRTSSTSDSCIIYTLDANGRYENRESLERLIDHTRSIGAFDRILFIEEPFGLNNDCHVESLGLKIAADESAYDIPSTLKRITQGYQVIIIKSIARTFSLTLDILRLAEKHNIPCVCADLTANPLVLEWHKNLAARIAPFPGLGMGMLETNGHLNYTNWTSMASEHPHAGSAHTRIKDGLLFFDDQFYSNGALFQRSARYKTLLEE